MFDLTIKNSLYFLRTLFKIRTAYSFCLIFHLWCLCLGILKLTRRKSAYAEEHRRPKLCPYMEAIAITDT